MGLHLLPGLLLCLAAAAPAVQAGAQRPWSAVERERWVREHALHPVRSLERIEAALLDPRWPRRAAALEALRRAWVVGTLASAQPLPARVLERVVAIASDPAAPERASALAALACAPDPPRVPARVLDETLEASPAVALSLARLLERVDRERALPRLERLVEHLDGRVRDAALDALAARGDGAGALASAIARLVGDEGESTFVAGLERLERCSSDAAALDELARRLRGDPGLDTDRRAAALAGVEAVRLVVHGKADLQLLVRGWEPAAAWSLQLHGLLLRAARSARATGAPLCAALIDAAGAQDQSRSLLEGAVGAAAPERVVTLAAERGLQGGELAEMLWTLLAGRSERWSPDVVAPWLTTGRDAELRAAVVDALAAALAESGDEGSGRLLAGLLRDADARLAEDAFRALCAAPDPDPWLDDLHSAWAALPPADRIARLRRLPRDRPLEPFRDDLMELGERDVAARAQCAELLGPWRWQQDVAERLAGWLQSASGGDDVDAERRAIAIVRALGGVGLRDPELNLLIQLVVHAGEDDLAVAKTTVAVLAALPVGDLVLEPWLGDDDLPSRLRMEAALQLAPTGSARALAVLDERYDSCDAILRARAVRAAAVQPDRATTALLRRVAFDAAEASELRRLAVDGLAAHGERELLLQLLAQDRHPDVRDAAITGLGVVGDEVAQIELLALLAAIESQERRASAEELTAERESLLVALAACGAWSPGLQASWLARPLALARDDLATRLRGEHLGPPPFRFRGELALARSRAERSALAAALEASGPWWQADGRLLGHLGVDALAGEPRTAERLLQAAWVALAGEDSGEDGPQLRFELRRRLLAAAEARADWSRVAALTEDLLADWRALRLPRRAFVESFGVLDPARGVDPRARLESAALQARAREALERGEQARARALAAAARTRLGASADALRAQERLEATLGAR